MDGVPTIDYATPTRTRRINRRMLIKIAAILVAALALAWSLTLPSHLILSNRGLPVGNEAFAVRVLVRDPSSRNEFRLYAIRSFAGFHLVDWGEWHRDGRYLVIPKVAMIVLTSGALLVLLVVACRSAVRP